jgi:hypothetical protein
MITKEPIFQLTSIKVALIGISMLFSFNSSAQKLHQVLNLNGYWKFTLGDDLAYAAPSHNDSSWEKIYAPANWENEGFRGYDGFAWYRKEFDASSISDLENLYLSLGYIDDADQVFINGKLIGYSGSFPPNFQTAYQALRVYPISNTILEKGKKNVIAVRIYDVVHEGGMVSGSLGFFSPNQNNNFLSFEGLWKFKEGTRKSWQDPALDDSNWSSIMVPATWKSRDYWFNYREAWYRRTFNLPQQFKGKDLVLLGGKIDDFDQIYINGELIGTTNDGREYGSSDSYQVLRKYKIPAGLLKERGNTIAVKVIDLGNNAGIYEGPVGIAIQGTEYSIIRSYNSGITIER